MRTGHVDFYIHGMDNSTRRGARAPHGAAFLSLAVLVTLVLLAPGARAAGEGGVLVVGDSLEVQTSPYLERYLPGVPLTVNAAGGYNSYQILELFEESYDPSQSVIVFDAGTNDNPAYPQILAENLQKVAATVGDRCMVVPTIYGFTVDGVDNTGKNRVVREFAASRPGTQAPDWARVAETRKDLMQADDLHPTEAGAEYRAQLIAQGIQTCLAYGEAPPAPPEASGSAAAAAARVEVTRMKPVGRIAARRAEIVEAVAGGALRQAAALAAVRMLLPG